MSSFAPSLEEEKRAGIRVTRLEYPPGLGGVKLSLEQIAQRIREGALSPKVQGAAADVLLKAGFNGRGNDAGTTRQRAATLLNYVRQTVLYAPDPPGTEYVKSAEAMLCLRPGLCVRIGDCFPKGALLIRRNGEPNSPGPFAKLGRVFIEDVREGDEIWGFDKWTTVRRQWAVGERTLDRIVLDTGRGLVDEEHAFYLSPEHHIFVQKLRAPGTPYSGPLGPHSFGSFERVRLADFEPGANSWLPRPGPTGEPACPIRVKRVERNVAKADCYDITTDDGFVYLPEHDVTVSNCDDGVVLLGSMLMGVGIPVNVIKQTFGFGDQEHVLLEAMTEAGPFPLDPSSDLPAGQKTPASHEFKLDPSNPSMIGLQGVPDAEFIGVGGIPKGFGALRTLPPVGVGSLTDPSTWSAADIFVGVVTAGILGGLALGAYQRYGKRRGKKR
jgi:hypothetical protein